MKKYLAFLLLAGIIFTSGCSFFETHTDANNDIDADVRAEIAPLNKKLFNYLMAKDVKGVKSLMSKVLLDSAGKSIDTIVNTVGNTFSAKNFKVLDEYYTTHASSREPTVIKSAIHNYTIEYRALNDKMYTSLLVSENLPLNFSILVMYGKYSDGWKMNILSVNNYSILGKICPDYYEQAMQKYRKGDTIDAAVNMIAASKISTPGGKHFKYLNDEDMQTFISSIITEANSVYHFPLTVKQVKTTPQIFNVTAQMIDDKAMQGVYPLIRYKTSIPLTDTIALKAENNALQKAVGGIFKGIDQDKRFIIYEAFDKMPNMETTAKYYLFMQKIPAPQ